MTDEESLLTLAAMDPPVLIVPESETFPISPTQALQQVRKLGGIYRYHLTTMRLDFTQIRLARYGICRVIEPRIVSGEEINVTPFPGRKSVADAIARIDKAVRPLPLRDEWMLTHVFMEDRQTLVETVPFWLGSRQQAFVAVLSDMDDKEESVPRAPVVVARSLTAPPDTPLQ